MNFTGTQASMQASSSVAKLISRGILYCYRSPIWIIGLALFAAGAVWYSAYNIHKAAVIGSWIVLGIVLIMAAATPLWIDYVVVDSRLPWGRAILQSVFIVVAFLVTFQWLVLSDVVVQTRMSFLKWSPNSFLLNWWRWVIIPGIFLGSCFVIIMRREIVPLIDGLRSGRWFGVIRPTHVLLFVMLLMVVLSALYALRGQWNVTPTSDAYFYERMGFELALGHGFVSTYYQPLYLIWLAGLYYFFGHFFFLIQIANVLCVVATILFLYAAIRIWTRNVPVALIGALLIATSNTTVYWVYTSQVEPFNQLLVAINFYLFARVFQDDKPVNAAIWGLSWALLILCRTQNAGLLIGQVSLYLIMFIAAYRKTWWGNISRPVVSLTLAFIFFIIPMTIWGTYNLYSRGQFMMTSPRGALDFWRGNFPGFRDGIFYHYYNNEHHYPKNFDAEYDKLTKTAKTREEINRLLVCDGFRLIISQPLAAIDRATKRFVLLMDLYRPGWYTGRATNWHEEWQDYVRQGYRSMLALGSISLMLIFFRGWLLWSSLVLIFSYMLPFLFILNQESRVRWPIDHLYFINIAVLIYYALTARKLTCICDKSPEVEFAASSPQTAPHAPTGPFLSRAFSCLKTITPVPAAAQKTGIIFAMVILVLGGSRVMLGAANVRAPLKAEGAKQAASIMIEDIYPELPPQASSGVELWKDDKGGELFLMECVPTNYSAGDDAYYTWPPPLPDSFSHCTYSTIALSFKGAAIEAGIREGDRILILGRVRSLGNPTIVQVERGIKIK